MHLPPSPEPRQLLPPLLACLPTAFVSLHPPPALLPLLSPLLRQRVTFLTANEQPTSRSDGWLPLLSWDGQRGARLPAVVERMNLEPHPISGEVEIEDLRPAKYRRLDEETLQSRLEVEQFEILPVYVWCDSDEHGETGPGWKLADLRTMDDVDESEEWHESISQANSAASLRKPSSLQGGAQQSGHKQPKQEEDDSDYWASYDRTPGQTPAANRSPAPRQQTGARQQGSNPEQQAEHDYFTRYGNEVQPAMDAYDPNEEHGELGESSLNGDSLVQSASQTAATTQKGGAASATSTRPLSRPNGASLFPADPVPSSRLHPQTVQAPRALSPSSSHSSIDTLERKAAAMSNPDGEGEDLSRAQRAITQHISTDIKSLFRLARSTGMERREFEEIVQRELEVLSMLERDE